MMLVLFFWRTLLRKQWHMVRTQEMLGMITLLLLLKYTPLQPTHQHHRRGWACQTEHIYLHSQRPEPADPRGSHLHLLTSHGIEKPGFVALRQHPPKLPYSPLSGSHTQYSRLPIILPIRSGERKGLIFKVTNGQERMVIGSLFSI